MSERGHYGPARTGQIALPATTVYVEREPSAVARIFGTIAVVGAALWARHQSRQIEQLYKTTGLPYQSFTASAGASLRGLAARVRPKGRNDK
jgi:hypothetical protein